MKFSMNKSDLKTLTNQVNKFVPNKAAKPILVGIKIVSNKDNQSITLTGSDGNTSIIDTIKADKNNNLSVAESGAVVVSARFFKSVINNMPAKSITLYTKKSKQGITVRMKSGRSNFKINSLFADNYPVLDISGIKQAKPITVNAEDFQNAIDNVIYAAKSSNNDPQLSSVHMIFDKDSMHTEATDSHRGSMYDVNATNKTGEKDPITELIDHKTLSTFKGLFNKKDDVEIYYNGTSQVYFKQNGIIAFTTTVVGADKYPDIKDALKKVTSKYVMNVKASSLSAVVKRASLVSKLNHDDEIQFNLDPSNNVLTVTSDSKLNNGTKEDIPVQVSRKPKDDSGSLIIHLNPEYIMDALKPMGDSTVAIGFSDNVKPTFWMPLSKTNQHGYLQFIMPIQIH